MSNCIAEELESSMHSIRSSLLETFSSKVGQASFDETITQMDAKFSKLMTGFNEEAINYCLKKFINAELDFQSPGKRGIGRMTAYIPRMGAFYRKRIKKFTGKELEELHALIQDIIIRGYLVHVLFLEEDGTKQGAIQSKDELFMQWIPSIYLHGKLSESLTAHLRFSTLSACKSVKIFLGEHNIRAGWLFSKMKLDWILWGYVNSGFMLRFTEVNP